MNTRLQQFLAAENISQSQFADNIGVARASVSHIISGRNKPGFDFIESMSKRYPSLNLDWLILGKGRMYNTDSGAKTPLEVPVEPENGLFDLNPELDGYRNPEPSIPPVQAQPSVQTQTKTESKTLGNKPEKTIKQRSISKIIILYDDGSFQELK